MTNNNQTQAAGNGATIFDQPSVRVSPEFVLRMHRKGLPIHCVRQTSRVAYSRDPVDFYWIFTNRESFEKAKDEPRAYRYDLDEDMRAIRGLAKCYFMLADEYEAGFDIAYEMDKPDEDWGKEPPTYTAIPKGLPADLVEIKCVVQKVTRSEVKRGGEGEGALRVDDTLYKATCRISTPAYGGKAECRVTMDSHGKGRNETIATAVERAARTFRGVSTADDNEVDMMTYAAMRFALENYPPQLDEKHTEQGAAGLIMMGFDKAVSAYCEFHKQKHGNAPSDGTIAKMFYGADDDEAAAIEGQYDRVVSVGADVLELGADNAAIAEALVNTMKTECGYDHPIGWHCWYYTTVLGRGTVYGDVWGGDEHEARKGSRESAIAEVKAELDAGQGIIGDVFIKLDEATIKSLQGARRTKDDYKIVDDPATLAPPVEEAKQKHTPPPAHEECSETREPATCYDELPAKIKAQADKIFVTCEEFNNRDFICRAYMPGKERELLAECSHFSKDGGSLNAKSEAVNVLVSRYNKRNGTKHRADYEKHVCEKEKEAKQ